MPELNRANRQVCDVDIRNLKTKKPFMFFDTANVTTVGLTGDSVYAMAKGARKIAFPNPITGQLSIEAEVRGFKFFALYSDGTIDTSATFAKHETIRCTTDGQLTLNPGSGNSIATGSVFVFPVGEYGNEASEIVGSYATNVFTATTASELAVDSDYEVGYLLVKTGVRKVAFSNKKLPKDYFITMSTLDKDEDGTYAPFIMTAYKASIQRTWELSFNSEGDPASITATFDLMEDKDGNILDMVEDTDDPVLAASKATVGVVKGGSSPDVQISGATGALTVTIKDSSDVTATKVHAVVSGDHDNVIITADADADAGNYTVTLADASSGTVVINVVVSAS